MATFPNLKGIPQEKSYVFVREFGTAHTVYSLMNSPNKKIVSRKNPLEEVQVNLPFVQDEGPIQGRDVGRYGQKHDR